MADVARFAFERSEWRPAVAARAPLVEADRPLVGPIFNESQ
jgi:hypothetical protein